MDEIKQSNILGIQAVSKKYATKTAVDTVSFTVPKGIIFGLLGPNGAGKTTLIRMITHITMPDTGKILFENEPLTEKHQALMGYMPEERGLYKKMKIGEQLVYLTQLRGLSKKDATERMEHWLARFQLTEYKNRKLEELSKGMQQKVQFIVTVAHNPPLLILDEPASGLDPINAMLIEEIIKELKSQGVSILFSTHRMEQVEQICDSIALINNGKLLLQGDIKTIKKQYLKNIYLVEAETIPKEITLPANVKKISQTDTTLEFQLPQNVPPKEVLSILNQHLTISRFELILPSIRDIFIETISKTEEPIINEA